MGEESLREDLKDARREIISMAEAGVNRLADYGCVCDPAERTYGPAVARIDAALATPTQPAAGQGAGETFTVEVAGYSIDGCAITPSTSKAAPLSNEAWRRVDGQVVSAARSLCAERRAQPEWLWFEQGTGLTSFGRWPKSTAQAPYVRADIAIKPAPPAPADDAKDGRS